MWVKETCYSDTRREKKWRNVTTLLEMLEYLDDKMEESQFLEKPAQFTKLSNTAQYLTQMYSY